jgi:shikimate 5-dehydrogenase
MSALTPLVARSAAVHIGAGGSGQAVVTPAEEAYITEL